MAGLGSGLTEALVVNPFEVVKVSLQANRDSFKVVRATAVNCRFGIVFAFVLSQNVLVIHFESANVFALCVSPCSNPLHLNRPEVL